MSFTLDRGPLLMPREAPESSPTAMIRRGLLFCGIGASLLYVAAVVLGAVRWEGYSSTSQTVSELSAIDAPSRPFVVPLLLAHSVVALAFGIGVLRSAGRTRALRVTGWLLVGVGVVDVVAPWFPMHLRGAEAALTDTMHIAVTSVTVLLIFLAIGFGARAFGKRFRLYSVATIVIFLVFGAQSGLQGPQVDANEPTPWLGVFERINIGAYLLWMTVLAVALLRGRHAPPKRYP